MRSLRSTTGLKTLALTALAMVAFAANSLLCRAALRDTAIDPASFTAVRIASGALALWLIVRLGRRAAGSPVRAAALAARPDAPGRAAGSWASGFALFVYAAAFSYAYLSLPAAVGALLLFGAVQTTMIGYGLWRGERLQAWQVLGLALACAGLVGLLLPGLSAPPAAGAALMIAAGVAWGVYSLRGFAGGPPTATTAGNFARALPFAVALGVVMASTARADAAGLAYALASGALASGVGYAIWYSALPGLRAASAATVQLSVPVIAALGGVAFLDEAITVRLAIAAAAVLGGIALVVAGPRR